MFKLFLIGFIIFWFQYCKSQNLVPNWSFELIDSCPPGHTVGYNNWIVQNWERPPGSITTPDLFSTCYNGTTPTPPYQDVSVPVNFMGHANPKTGNNYMGALLRYGTFREYIQVQLIAPLVIGQKYLCGFNVQRADSSEFQIDKVGMHISNISEYQNANQAMSNLSPQIENKTGIMYDSLNWLNVENVYHAIGGEQYITIGNFYTNANTLVDSIDIDVVGSTGWAVCCRGYYLFDDVYIYPYNENLQVNFPDKICRGKAITVSASGSAKYEWTINDNYYSNDSIISFVADTNITIRVNGYSDTLTKQIEVIECPIDCSGNPIIPNIFTPNQDFTNDSFTIKGIEIGCFKVTILNRWGNIVFESSESDVFWNGLSQEGKQVSDGTYFYLIEVTDNENKTKRYNGFLTLIR